MKRTIISNPNVSVRKATEKLIFLNRFRPESEKSSSFMTLTTQKSPDRNAKQSAEVKKCGKKGIHIKLLLKVEWNVIRFGHYLARTFIRPIK